MRNLKSGLVAHFTHRVGISLGALLLSANLAAAHKTSAPNPSFNFDPSILCGDAKGLHAGKSDCYGIFAKQMIGYANHNAGQYLRAGTIDKVTEILRQENPTSIQVDRDKKIVRARWKDDEGKLHREGKPAYIKIDLAKKSYVELWIQKGEFSRPNHMPTFLKYISGQKIKLQWDDGKRGLHNQIGPALAENNLKDLELALKWATQGTAGNPVDPKGGPTYAEIDLRTNVAYFQEFASGDGRKLQRMHRHDCVQNQHRDRETGALAEITFHYHDRDFNTDDEIAVKITLDPKSGKVIKHVWTKNDIEIPPPKNFKLPENHYCQDPGHSHPAAKYK